MEKKEIILKYQNNINKIKIFTKEDSEVLVSDGYLN